ncbi:cobalt ABC transporter ATP-binding subunit [Spiroplasma cantharicola]|uniref:Energy-coupling factor transporter ATP-binding protein EcfA2 n=1 Tax=Spiroplasma cantharicola TaxID=362837 RepID=A0A0M4JXH6_9MOLU|nr:energy-coupling factor transporter ATPase [Spiroplasma cantharicola]ALD66817.1 cobalt ABC transporter ATP-binding subunit [Spiroplasma cantharicola]
MSKIKRMSPEQKAKAVAEKKEHKVEYKIHLKELSVKQKHDNKSRKKRHKEVKNLIKADRKNQKEYQKEIKANIKKDKEFMPERIKEVKDWYANQSKKDSLIKKEFKRKLKIVSQPKWDFNGEIKFESVAYTYSKNSPFEFRALNGTDLIIEEKKITAVIGMTGSGKSTLIQLTNGLLVTETGRTKIGDFQIPASTKKIKQVKELRREVGLVFQFPEYQLFQDTIEKDISFGPINLGANKKESFEKVPDLLKMVDLPIDYAKRSPFDLSGGQKRRVAIAGIIAMDGNTLVLDEPTGGLDPQGEEDFMNLFNKLNKEKNKRIIIVTHNMDHVLQIADQVIVMHKGKVISKGTPFEIFSNNKLLEQIEIEPPKLYKLAHKLKKAGLDVTRTEFRSVEELAKAIKEAVKAKRK